MGDFEELIERVVRKVVREELDAHHAEPQGTLVSQQAACKALGVSPKTLRQFVRGGMPETRLGAQSPRYDIAACEEWLRKRSG